MVKELAQLRQKIKIGIVGGSDLSKQVEQLGENGEFDISYRCSLFIAALVSPVS